MNITAQIITIGDEILYGQTTDTNAQWMSSQLDSIGIKVTERLTIGDTRQAILEALANAEKKADIVLLTGGLGPTEDDLTKPCLAEYFKVALEEHKEALDDITRLFKKYKFELTPVNKLQAHLPTNCTKITNKLGTAPGMWFFENNTVFVAMPGVPFEMKAMMRSQILPKLQEQFNLPVIYHKVVKTIGIGESWLADKIAPWAQQLPKTIQLAYLPSLREVKLRLTSTGSALKTLQLETRQQIDDLKKYAGSYIYGYDNDTIESVTGQLLLANLASLGTAESCTGGYLAHLITSVPGSSAYFKGSIIAYANQVKEQQLGVSPTTLATHGAVSKQTAIEMAQGARQQLNTTYALATTGIAGPDGGTPDKPVGTIWIALATPATTHTKLLSLSTERSLNIQATAKAALTLLWQTLK